MHITELVFKSGPKSRPAHQGEIFISLHMGDFCSPVLASAQGGAGGVNQVNAVRAAQPAAAPLQIGRAAPFRHCCAGSCDLTVRTYEYTYDTCTN